MRVLVVHNRYRSAAPSGENRVVDEEGKALVADGHQVERFERLSDDIDHWSATQRAMLPAKVVWNDETRRSLAGHIRRFRPDVVHVHNTFPLISPSVLRACRSTQVPVVATVHNYKLVCATGELFRDGAVCHDCVGRTVPLPALAHQCYRHSVAATAPVVAGLLGNRRAWRTLVSAYVFISDAQRQICSPLGLPAARTFVKPNLIPRLAPLAADRQPMVAYLGRLDLAKGIPLLMDAWDRFAATPATGGLRLVIAGGGVLEDRVKRWAATRSSVEAVGLLDARGCAELLARARAVLLPSQWEETFGLVAVEAMAAGVPPVAAGHGSFPELVHHGVDGVLFEPGSAAGLSAVLADIASHPSRFEALGRQARQTYLRRFDPEDNLRQLLAIYRFAVEQPVWADRHGSGPGPS